MFLDAVCRLFAGLEQLSLRPPPSGLFRLQLLIELEQLGPVVLQSPGQFLARLGQLLLGALVFGDFVPQFLGGPGQLCLDSLAVGRLGLHLVCLLRKFRRPFPAEFFQVGPRVLECLLDLFSFGRFRLQRLRGLVQLTGQVADLRLKSFSRVGQVRFQRCALGQVGHHPEGTFELPIRRADRRGGKEGQAFGAVLAAKAQFSLDRPPFLLFGEHLLCFALRGFRDKIDDRALNQLLDLVAQDLGHLRVNVVGVELGIEQPDAFVSGMDQAVKSLTALTQRVFEFLALEEFLHLPFRNAQPHIQHANVVRFGQKIIGADGEDFTHIRRLSRRSRDHDECLLPL